MTFAPAERNYAPCRTLGLVRRSGLDNCGERFVGRNRITLRTMSHHTVRTDEEIHSRAGWKPTLRVLAGLVAVVGAIFWCYSRQPLYHTDLWGHLAYGRLIWETGALPKTEPFM